MKLDNYQKCGNVILQTSLLLTYTGSETGVAMVVGLSLVRGKIFTASIGSLDSLYLSVFSTV